MTDFTPFARLFFKDTLKRCRVDSGDIEARQRATLDNLLQNLALTAYGKKYGITKHSTLADFRRLVPVVEYPALRPWVMKMVEGRPNVLWPGIVSRFAQSSGTSDGVSKYIPLSRRSLFRTHYEGARAVVASYLDAYPDSRIFSGKSFILGGSFANGLTLPKGVYAGDLSAHLISNLTFPASLMRVPSKKTALMPDWHEKLPRLVAEAAHADVTNISGVPSWFLTVIKRIVAHAGASTIHDVWPNLEVFFHGGIAFDPYRHEYNRLTDPSRMHYMETYNASEGFFAVQDDPSQRGMRLLMNVETFYEFIPVDRPEAAPLAAWEVALGEIYTLCISACNGLWRYVMGDTVKVMSVSPLRISIVGRTRSFINAFGEELMVFNADEAIAEAERATGAMVADYNGSPVYADQNHKGRHRWIIEFGRMPDSVEHFAEVLDSTLARVNSDYAAKRSGSIFLDPPEIIVAPHGLFDRWLAKTGKLGGQRKVPRLCNDSSIADALLNLMKT